jgi:hypothetical protein
MLGIDTSTAFPRDSAAARCVAQPVTQSLSQFPKESTWSEGLFRGLVVMPGIGASTMRRRVIEAALFAMNARRGLISSRDMRTRQNFRGDCAHLLRNERTEGSGYAR